MATGASQGSWTPRGPPLQYHQVRAWPELPQAVLSAELRSLKHITADHPKGTGHHRGTQGSKGAGAEAALATAPPRVTGLGPSASEETR